MAPATGAGAGSSSGKKVKEGKGKKKGKSKGGSDSADRAAHKGAKGSNEDGRVSGNESADDDERQARAGGRGRRRRAPNSAHAQLFDGGLQCSSEEEESVIGEEQLLGGIQVELEPLGTDSTDTRFCIVYTRMYSYSRTVLW